MCHEVQQAQNLRNDPMCCTAALLASGQRGDHAGAPPHGRRYRPAQRVREPAPRRIFCVTLRVRKRGAPDSQLRERHVEVTPQQGEARPRAAARHML